MEPKYDCENYGDQGITAGCKDIYYYNIDCQWIDVTELPLGTYTFKMAINPEYKVNQSVGTQEGMKRRGTDAMEMVGLRHFLATDGVEVCDLQTESLLQLG